MADRLLRPNKFRRYREHPEPQVVDFEKNFWQFARDVAAHTEDEQHSLQLLIAQFRSVCPQATQSKLAAAEDELRSLLRMGA